MWLHLSRLKTSLSDTTSQISQHRSVMSYLESLSGPAADTSLDDDDTCILDDDDTCIICFEQMTHHVVTPCKHHFCHSCITKCLNANGRCPTCRHAVNPNDLTEVEVSVCIQLVMLVISCSNVQNPLDTFPRSFPVDEELGKLLRTC